MPKKSLDAAFAIKLLDIRQTELLQEVLGGAPAWRAAFYDALLGTRDQLLPPQRLDGGIAFGAADRGHFPGRDRLAQGDDGERFECLVGEWARPAFGAQAGDDILAISLGFELPLCPRFAELEAAPGPAQLPVEQVGVGSGYV